MLWRSSQIKPKLQTPLISTIEKDDDKKNKNEIQDTTGFVTELNPSSTVLTRPSQKIFKDKIFIKSFGVLDFFGCG